MIAYEGAVQDLIDALSCMPGIGPKSAQRLAFHLIAEEHHEDGQRLADAIVKALDGVHFCERCHNVSEGDLCRVCRNPKRDPSLICVVGGHVDVSAIEKTGAYPGLYHVLGGLISPLDGVMPEHLNVRSLVERLADGVVREVIIATDPTIEGTATAAYLQHLIGPIGVTVSRIGTGLPMGREVNFADESTLTQALEGRRTMGG